ncbi:MAG: hypothetical protein E6J41_20890 [Chloroflexi bacterium]|nr:MAG: hypothetical protein E6J41_20890 [Chloroflexota bacterium]
MASNVICGRCSAPLEHPSAPCRNCGARPNWTALERRRKSPLAAAALAIVPGLGHLYLGEWRKAAGIMGAAGLLEFVGLDFDLTAVGAVIGVPMELGGVGLWLYSIFDAYHSAKRLRGY